MALLQREEHRVVILSERQGVGDRLGDMMSVTVAPIATADSLLPALRADVLVIDASDEARFAEVARIALAGARTVIVLGPPRFTLDAVRYLELGATDYVRVDAAPVELIARIHGAARRARPHDDDAIHCGPVAISIARHEVRRGSDIIRLTPREFELLHALASTPGTTVPYRLLLQAIGGAELKDASQALRVYVTALRNKLEDDPARPTIIETDRGVGYRLVTDGVAEGASRIA